jgi:hypothetical protein
MELGGSLFLRSSIATGKLGSEWGMSHGDQWLRNFLINFSKTMEVSWLGMIMSCFGKLILWQLGGNVVVVARYRL